LEYHLEVIFDQSALLLCQVTVSWMGQTSFCSFERALQQRGKGERGTRFRCDFPAWDWQAGPKCGVRGGAAPAFFWIYSGWIYPDWIYPL